VKRRHQMPFGAECRDDGSVRFRLWAPEAGQVELCLTASNVSRLALAKVEHGWFELVTAGAAAGSRYQFQIDGQTKVPDPASRFQPVDAHGPSEVIDPHAFEWADENWRGRPWEEAVIYELHVGAFTAEGTFAAVQQKLDYLAHLGVTALELMPVADFPGKRNWGYDGVLPYAPDSSYGRPEDLKRLIQAAHAKGLMVFLDVVHNHFGPEGNYLRVYAPQFFTSRRHTPWGDGINFDGPGSPVVRDFFIQNALYWLEEYHFDGLRLDAVHAIQDDSKSDILTELAECVRKEFRSNRLVHLVLENDQNAVGYLKRDARGHAKLYDAQWNDDIHHALHVLLTGEKDGYYSDYTNQPFRHLARCLTEGFSYQGEDSAYRQNKPRGKLSANLPPVCFVSFLQNHDQVGNRAFGERILELAPEQAVRAGLSILLLAPSPPLLFMGEEFGAKTPFLFFCDFGPELAAAVTEGRRAEFARFARFSAPAIRQSIPDPNAEGTFARSKLDWNEAGNAAHAGWLRFYRDLLALRQSTIVPHLRGIAGGRSRFAICDDNGLAVEWELGDGSRLKLLANLSDDSLMAARPEGQMIYTNVASVAATLEQGTMPPWSVAWFLHS
jgi:maltooligosyltrehalose trehalohydrolase